MQKKLVHHINNQLPNLLENIKTTHDQRETRKQALETARDAFTEQFLNKTKYYYNQSTELFYTYNDYDYSIIKEDDIQHQILTSITHNKQLMSWKYKIKTNIIKQIRERDILKSIPESSTIQSVINNLYPTLFKTRNHAKYFLTIIGDIILKKTDLFYFIPSNAKNYLNDLNQQSCMLLGFSNLLNTFKFKYYEHNYSYCRLIDINDSVESINIWNQLYKQQMINFFCVAAHYSTRYNSADNFLTKHSKDNELIQHSLYLKKNTDDSIIRKFISHSTEGGKDCKISWKNILYLWKQFIDEMKIPNVIFSTTLKTKLINLLYYSSDDDCFLNLTSKQIPIVSQFMTFWDTCIDTSSDEIELEVDELSTLFNNWLNKNTLNISDSVVLGLVKHFYTDVVMEEDKYLVNVGCKLWDKNADINLSLNQYKQICKTAKLETPQPIYNAYESYCHHCDKQGNIVSKRYFEKFFMDTYSEYLDDDSFIKKEWWDVS